MRPRLVTTLAIALIGVASGAAHAAKRSARLSYVRGAGAETCPEESAVRASVAERLGYDPFEAEADRTVAVAIVRDSKGFHAQVEVRDEAGVVKGKRKLDSKGGDCSELAAAIELDIAIAIDPIAATGPLPLPPVEGPEVDGGTEETTASVASSSEEADGGTSSETTKITDVPTESIDTTNEHASVLRLLVSGGVGATYGMVPGPGVMLTIGAALRWSRVSLGFEGRVDLPTEQRIESEDEQQHPARGTIRVWMIGASIVPCLHKGIAFVCAVGTVGSFQASGSGNVTVQGRDEQVTSPAQRIVYLAAGGRLGVEVPISESLFFRFNVDVSAPLNRATVGYPNSRSSNAWEARVVNESLGAAFVGAF